MASSRRGHVLAWVADAGLLLLVALPALIPLARQGYLQGADAMDAPWRSLLLEQALRGGVLFPRWLPDQFLGYGFPLFNYYPPLSFYPAALLDLIWNIDLVNGTKLAFGAYLYLFGVGSYLLVRQLIRHRAEALLAGTIAMYAPANLIGVYVGSGLAGVAGNMMLPFTIAAYWHLCRTPRPAAFVLAAVSLATTMLMHNVAGLIALGTVLLACGFRFSRYRDLRIPASCAIAVALGLALAAFYWLPALAEIGYTHTEKTSSGLADFRYHLLDPLGPQDEATLSRIDYQPEEYKQTRWGLFDLHPAYPYGSIPYRASLLQGLLLVFSAVVLVIRRRQGVERFFWFLVTLLALFMHASWSRPLWETIPLLPQVQFPYRFDGLFGLSLAVVASWAVFSVRSAVRVPLALAVGVAVVASGIWELPSHLGSFADGLSPTMEGLRAFEHRERNRIGTLGIEGQFMPQSIQWDSNTMAEGDLLPRYNRQFPASCWVAETACVAPGDKAWILAARRGRQRMEARVEVGEPTLVAFHTIDFPGWKAYLDGQEVPIEPSSWYSEEGRWATLGVSQVRVPVGTHVIQLSFENTPTRAIAEALSLAGVICIGVVLTTLIGLRGWFPSLGSSAFVPLMWLALAVAGTLAYHRVVDAMMPQWTNNSVVADLQRDAQNRQLRLSVPLGSNPDDYVHWRTFTLHGETRPVVFMHPTASAAKKMWLPENSVLEFSLAIDPAVWDKSGDGVEFSVDAIVRGDTVQLFSHYIDPKSRPEDRTWTEGSVDLSRFAHEEIDLVLSTHPGTTGEFDWAGWAAPRVTIKSVSSSSPRR